MFKCLFFSFVLLVVGFFAGAFVSTQHPEWLNFCGCCPACFCPKACPAACPVKCQCDIGKACVCTNCECVNCKCCCCPGEKGV